MTHSGLLVLNLPSPVSLQSLPLPKAGWWYPSKFPACHPLQGHCGHLMLSLWGPDWLRRPQLADSTLWVLVQETEGEHGSDRHRHRRGSQAMSLLVQTKRAKLSKPKEQNCSPSCLVGKNPTCGLYFLQAESSLKHGLPKLSCCGSQRPVQLARYVEPYTWT